MSWMRDWKPREVGWLDQVRVTRKWQSGGGQVRNNKIKSLYNAYHVLGTAWGFHTDYSFNDDRNGADRFSNLSGVTQGKWKAELGSRS